MRKRIAKKIYRKVYDLLWSSATCFLYYTTVDVFGKFFFKDRPYSAIYSREQFAKALKVLKKAYPKSKLKRQGTSAKGNPINIRIRI